MSGSASIAGRSPCAAVRLAVVYLFIITLTVSPVCLAAEDQKPKPTLPLRVTVSVDWDVEGGPRNQGSLTMRMRGTLKLDEEWSLFPPDAPPGAPLVYSAEGVSVNYTYKETKIQDHPPQDCSPMMAEYEGSGVFQLESVGHPMLSGLTIRMSGSLIPKEMLALVPPEAREVMVDYYEFFTIAQKQEVHGRKRGWHDCIFKPDTREFDPGSLAISFLVTKGGKMSGSRNWAAKESSGTPSLVIRLSDLPENMEHEQLVPSPDSQGNVNYSVSWSFDEVEPFLEIQRKEGTFWVPLHDEEPVKVKIGEKVELRGVVLPEEKDAGRGEWTVPGRTIQEFVVKGDRGYADWLEASELKARELAYHWWDGEDGLEVKYETTSTDGKKLSESVVFDVKEPETALRADLGEGEFRVAEVKYEDPDGAIHQGRELVLVTDSGPTIRFSHDPLPGEFQPGATQFVQYVRTTGRVTKHEDALAGPCMQIENEGLDSSYPYAPGPETQDNPGVPVSLYDLTIAVEHSFTTQLMYKPELEGAIFVPLSELNWFWIGNCHRGSIADDWVTAGSYINAPAVGAPAEAFLEWGHVSTGEEVWDGCK